VHACYTRLRRRLRFGWSCIMISPSQKKKNCETPSPHLNGKNWVWWHVPFIPQMAENTSLCKKQGPISKIIIVKRVGGMAWVIEHLTSNCEAMSSNQLLPKSQFSCDTLWLSQKLCKYKYQEIIIHRITFKIYQLFEKWRFLCKINLNLYLGIQFFKNMIFLKQWKGISSSVIISILVSSLLKFWFAF
jgi:hypothetical protein